MIDHRDGEYIPVCDYCGAELPGKPDYEAARQSLPVNGWARRKNYETMENEHLCDSCVSIATGRGA